jgi:hypothetical protein
LQYTGIDEEKKFRIGWVDQDSGFECLKVACKGANAWVKVLSDSTDIATFACVTKQCFETTVRNRCCRGAIPQKLSLKPFQLCTQVSAGLQDCNSNPVPERLTLQDGETYWIGKEDLLLIATVELTVGAPPAMVLKVKRSSIPHQVFKRSNTRATIRETNEAGAVECIATAADQPPPEASNPSLTLVHR